MGIVDANSPDAFQQTISVTSDANKTTGCSWWHSYWDVAFSAFKVT